MAIYPQSLVANGLEIGAKWRFLRSLFRIGTTRVRSGKRTELGDDDAGPVGDVGLAAGHAGCLAACRPVRFFLSSFFLFFKFFDPLLPAAAKISS